MKSKEYTRRTFIMGTAGLLAGCATARRPRYPSANETLNVACIGVGGMGAGDVGRVDATGANIVALCDVDWKRAKGSFEAFPEARRYKDYREMLDKEKDIDAVTVSTPDHTHAPAALMAMALGKHVRVQKPMSWSVSEARAMTKAARKYNVATAMGNQGHAAPGVRRICEMLWSDAIGPVREAHVWTNHGGLPMSVNAPLPAAPVPENLDWNLWLGIAPERPYNPGYAPGTWRPWWDFGGGALGDMACHIMDPANWALQLGAPTSVECVMERGANRQTAPERSIIKYQFPARPFKEDLPSVKWHGKTLPPLTLYWYDGTFPDGTPNLPPRPAGIPENEVLGDHNDDGFNGSYFVGDDGVATTGCYGSNSRLLPAERMKDFVMPDEVIPRVDGTSHYEWVRACKGGPAAGSNFDYAGPFTEIVNLGNVALRVGAGKEIEWDGKRMKSPNRPEANQLLDREPRIGW
jgi:predicted dehydrogenase